MVPCPQPTRAGFSLDIPSFSCTAILQCIQSRLAYPILVKLTNFLFIVIKNRVSKPKPDERLECHFHLITFI